MRVREWQSTGGAWVEREYTDDEILDLFPDDEGSLVNRLLRRAQKAEAEVERLRAELALHATERGGLGPCELHDLRWYAYSDPLDRNSQRVCLFCELAECDAEIRRLRADAAIAKAEQQREER